MSWGLSWVILTFWWRRVIIVSYNQSNMIGICNGTLSTRGLRLASRSKHDYYFLFQVHVYSSYHNLRVALTLYVHVSITMHWGRSGYALILGRLQTRGGVLWREPSHLFPHILLLPVCQICGCIQGKQTLCIYQAKEMEIFLQTFV